MDAQTFDGPDEVLFVSKAANVETQHLALLPLHEVASFIGDRGDPAGNNL